MRTANSPKYNEWQPTPLKRWWRPAVLVKTRIWVGCSVSRGHKTWPRWFLFEGFSPNSALFNLVLHATVYFVSSRNVPLRENECCVTRQGDFLSCPPLRFDQHGIAISQKFRETSGPLSARSVPRSRFVDVTQRVTAKKRLWGRLMGHFRVPLGLCIKTRLGAQSLIWKWFFILMQIKLISTRKVEHLTSFDTEARGNSEMAFWAPASQQSGGTFFGSIW